MKHFLLAVIITCFYVCGYSQGKPQTRTINGKRYILHKVEKGHTLYSISVNYSVDISYIVNENPGSDLGIKEGQTLLIPIYRQDKSLARKNPPILRGEYLIHKVKRKETLFSLSREYGVSMNELEKHNPEVVSGLKFGMELKIPAQAIKVKEQKYLQAAGMNDNFVIHTVLPKETLYSLSKKYDVTIDELRDQNNGLEEGLKEGALIKVPQKHAEITVVDTASVKKLQELEDFTLTEYKQEEKSSFTSLNPGMSKLEIYNVALMLPFSVDDMEKLKLLGNDQIALEFYLGALIALDSLQKMGMNIRLHVFDTKKDPLHVGQLLSSPEMHGMHLFIGPLYKSSLLKVCEFAKETGAHVVSPVPQSLEVLLNNPNLSKVHGASSTQVRYLARYVASKHHGSNVLAIIPSENAEEKLMKIFNYIYTSTKRSLIGTSDTIKTYYPSGGNLENIELHLDSTRKNVVYIPVNNESYISQTLTVLYNLASDKNYEITVVGHEKWLKYNSIDTKYKNKLNLTLTSAFHSDYTSSGLLKYTEKYQAEYNTQPNKYGILGFDVTYYYLSGLHHYGLVFLEEFSEIPHATTSTRFKMNRLSGESGFENYASFLLKYENFEIKNIQ